MPAIARLCRVDDIVQVMLFPTPGRQHYRSQWVANGTHHAAESGRQTFSLTMCNFHRDGRTSDR